MTRILNPYFLLSTKNLWHISARGRYLLSGTFLLFYLVAPYDQIFSISFL
nr:MAG TPA: hypothetical protein [Caudoviricetes sp.]